MGVLVSEDRSVVDAWLASDAVFPLPRAATELIVLEGDITRQRADVIVSDATPSLAGSGGVEGALHRAAGPDLLAECIKIRSEFPQGLSTGQAVVTRAYELPARHVVHAVAPAFARINAGGPRDMNRAYLAALSAARGLGASTVALPALGCGPMGWPPHIAAPYAVQAVRSFIGDNPSAFTTVSFVVVGVRTVDAFRSAIETS